MDCLWKSWRLTATALNLISGPAYQHGKCIAKVLPLQLGFNVFIGADMALHTKTCPGYLAISSAGIPTVHADNVHGILLAVPHFTQVGAH